ncbi:MAG: TfoX/Sxy family protein [Acholeplasma sp.]|jgi:TfoX/Sxy family transcriptional regulator of competence genes|nr:TfoX/Sxy family protein [Acholeplasma sp.]
MASSQEYVFYVVERLKRYYDVSYRKMFGEYMVYIDQKPIILICDDQPYIKIHESTEYILKDAPKGYPYKGAKLHYLLDIDDIEVLRQVVDALLPFIVLKPKRKKIKPTV